MLSEYIVIKGHKFVNGTPRGIVDKYLCLKAEVLHKYIIKTV